MNRRHFLLSGLAATAALSLSRRARAAAPPVCRTAAEQEQGPFYVSGEPVRSDIREGKAGVPLQVKLTILHARTCQPLPRALVDLWHCDALGLYAGFTKMELGPPPSGPKGPRPFPSPGGPHGPGGPGGHGPAPTDQLTFLRGIQESDSDGVVRFVTIFPGFYQGRVNHIHFKVRTGGGTKGRNADGRHTAHVGQLFFPEALAVDLMAQAPYAQHRIHRTTAAEDHIFTDQHGSDSIARVQHDSTGLVAELAVAVDPDATPAPIQMGPPPFQGGPP